MPRTKQQLTALKETRRQAILDAALRVFADYGYAGSNMDAIAKQARVSKGLVYMYFESKDALLLAVLRSGMDKIEREFFSALTKKPIESKHAFSAMVNHWFVAFVHEKNFWRLYSMLLMQKGMTKKVEKELYGSLEEYLGVFQPYFKKKGSRDAVAEVFLFGSALGGVMSDLIISPKHYPLKKVIAMLVEKFG